MARCLVNALKEVNVEQNDEVARRDGFIISGDDIQNLILGIPNKAVDNSIHALPSKSARYLQTPSRSLECGGLRLDDLEEVGEPAKVLLDLGGQGLGGF